MQTDTLPPSGSMARKRTTLKPVEENRADVSTRMNSETLRLARTAAAWRNVTLVDWLNDVVRKAAETELAQIPKSK